MRCTILLLAACFAMAACKNKQETTKSQSDNSPKQEMTTPSGDAKLAVIDRERFQGDSDNLSILSAKMEGDILIVDVRYSGGCEEHTFDLVSNGFYAKSLPPKLPIRILHNANGDGCRQLIETSLSFNVQPLKYAGKGPLIMNLQGYDEPINYRYQ
ncbi:MAG: hypothetical protein HRT74_02185 [Flavobacteriales bacterium]|nr:hypothetical protein [Flavobacteriales bacterium]